MISMTGCSTLVSTSFSADAVWLSIEVKKLRVVHGLVVSEMYQPCYMTFHEQNIAQIQRKCRGITYGILSTTYRDRYLRRKLKTAAKWRLVLTRKYSFDVHLLEDAATMKEYRGFLECLPSNTTYNQMNCYFLMDLSLLHRSSFSSAKLQNNLPMDLGCLTPSKTPFHSRFEACKLLSRALFFISCNHFESGNSSWTSFQEIEELRKIDSILSAIL